MLDKAILEGIKEYLEQHIGFIELTNRSKHVRLSSGRPWIDKRLSAFDEYGVLETEDVASSILVLPLEKTEDTFAVWIAEGNIVALPYLAKRDELRTREETCECTSGRLHRAGQDDRYIISLADPNLLELLADQVRKWNV
jgi:hypothetical protein